MTHRRNLILALLLLPIAACSSEQKADDAATSQQVASPTHPEPAAPWDAKEQPGSDVATAPASPTSAEPDIARSAQQIPPAVQGRWGLVAADCIATRGDAKGLLTVTPTSLRFYESVGTLTRVRERERRGIVGEFSFSGEGSNWNRTITLEAQEGGQSLVRRDKGEGAAPDVLKYMRCKG